MKKQLVSLINHLSFDISSDFNGSEALFGYPSKPLVFETNDFLSL